MVKAGGCLRPKSYGPASYFLLTPPLPAPSCPHGSSRPAPVEPAFLDGEAVTQSCHPYLGLGSGEFAVAESCVPPSDNARQHVRSGFSVLVSGAKSPLVNVNASAIAMILFMRD